MRYYLDNFCHLDNSNMLWTLTNTAKVQKHIGLFKGWG
jgi:hypothetical protein